MRALLLIALVASLAACQPRATKEHPVVIAVLANDVPIVEQFLAEGGDPDMTNREGDALIYIGAGPKGGVEVVATLLRAGADPNGASAEGRTALANAVGWCDAEMVALLLAAGADPDMLTRDGATFGDVACKQPVDAREQTLRLLTE